VLLQDVTCPRQPGTLGATHLAHDGPASFRHSGTVIVWRDQAKHAAESLSKGSRVVVVGRLQQRAWTAEDGSARSTVEVVAEELGPSLRWATATPSRATRPA
jgi:single-stranded DNA-binding protein